VTSKGLVAAACIALVAWSINPDALYSNFSLYGASGDRDRLYPRTASGDRDCLYPRTESRMPNRDRLCPRTESRMPNPPHALNPKPEITDTEQLKCTKLLGGSAKG
jgi:hypothetical protein